MKSKNLKTVNVLESMTKYKTFSRYNKILEKNFKNNSLKSLVHNFSIILLRPLCHAALHHFLNATLPTTKSISS